MRRSVLVFAVVGWVTVAAPSARASCAGPITEASARAAVEVVFIGEALPGQTIPGVGLAPPYRFRVERYLKGSGPLEVLVATAFREEGSLHFSPRVEPGSSISGSSVDFRAMAGARYVIYANPEPEGFLNTNGCSGSHIVGQPSLFEQGPSELTPSPTSTPHEAAAPSSGWGGFAAAGAGGLAATMLVGYGVARRLGKLA